MSETKHSKADGSPLGDDLKDNPGIGQSPGLFATGEDPNTAAGENTVEGDVDNDASPTGAVDESIAARANS